MTKKIILFLITSIIFSFLSAQKMVLKKSNSSEKQTSSLININNWQYWEQYNGISAHSPYEDVPGGVYPKNKTEVIFQDGFVWAGFVQDNDPTKPSLRIGGQTYFSGTQPGWIKIPGDALNPPIAVSHENDSIRIYRVRSDIFTVSNEELRKDASDIYNLPLADITANHLEQLQKQYINDWKEWPGNLGAPYYDRNRNGQWDPGYDEPGIAGAGQTIWYVVNDVSDSVAISKLVKGSLIIDGNTGSPSVTIA